MAGAVCRFALAALLIAGCARGDTLVVVTVHATPALRNVARLHTTSVAGGQTVLQDVGGAFAPFTIGNGVTKTFGVQVPSSISGSFSIRVEALDASGTILAKGDGMTTLSPGNSRNIPITLTPPVNPAEPVWIGSGGSAASSTSQLNVSVGVTDTVGSAAAPSGVVFSSGFFASQAY